MGWLAWQNVFINPDLTARGPEMDPHFRFVHAHPSPIPLVMHEEYSGHEHHDANNNSGDSVAVAEPALGTVAHH